MNKSIALAVAFATVSTAAFADIGQVLFNNSKVTQPVFFADGTTKITTASYVAQLFYSTDGTSFSAIGTPAAFNTVAAKAGYWSGNTKNLVFPDPIHDAQALTLKVAVWDSSLFASWDAAAAEAASLAVIPGKLAQGDKFQIGTTTFAYTTPAASDLGAEAAYIKNFKSFNLTEYTVAAPEPSVIALGAIGVGALLLRRRK